MNPSEVTYETFVSQLAAACPGFAAEYPELVSPPLLPHVALMFFTDHYLPKALGRRPDLDEPDQAACHEGVVRVLQLLEAAAASSEEKLVDLVFASFIEHIINSNKFDIINSMLGEHLNSQIRLWENWERAYAVACAIDRVYGSAAPRTLSVMLLDPQFLEELALSEIEVSRDGILDVQGRPMRYELHPLKGSRWAHCVIAQPDPESSGQEIIACQPTTEGL